MGAYVSIIKTIESALNKALFLYVDESLYFKVMQE